jgi:RNA polymerase sigma factor (sigma-70 family)
MTLQPESAHSAVENTVLETDADLWEAFKSGNEEAFARIYHTLVQDLYNYGLNIAAAPELVEDCIQDLFIYIWDTKDKLGRTDNIKFYLFTALKRRILVKTEENQKKDLLLHTTWISSEKPDFSSEALLLSSQQEQEQSERLEKALQALTPRQREAIYLRFYDKLSYAQIASIMSLTIQSTYSLIARAMEGLREQMHLVLVHLFLLLFS